MEKYLVTWQEVFNRLANTVDKERHIVYGVPKGGMLASAFLRFARVTNDPEEATIILDDIIDSGATRARYKEKYPQKEFMALFNSNLWVDAKTGVSEKKWVVFPWEIHEQSGPEDAVIRLLQFIGEDVHRDGLKGTPGRVLRALSEMTKGTKEKAADILHMQFEHKNTTNEMVVLSGVEFTSLCEHHLLPFSGEACIGYLPQGKVIGLSKLARLIDSHARRLQIQERMTEDIVNDLLEFGATDSAACIVRAVHSCMACRGVKKRATMVTSCLRGAFFEKPEARKEFLDLCQTR